MPPITLHMVVATRIADALGHPVLSTDEGAFVLGATTPDIRVLTRQDRNSTHFFDLGVHDHQDSVAGFLATYSDLVDPAAVDGPTASFTSGYISHLVMDEQYITGIYRPYFGDHDALGGTIRANVMDRLLQFELDRIHGSSPEVKRRLAEALALTVEDIQCGFIDSETLAKWRDVAADVAGREMDWERARGMIANHLRYSGLREGESLTEFLDGLPSLRDETIAYITDAEVAGFVERCSDAATRAVERYLS